MFAARKFEVFYDDPFEPLLIAVFEDLDAARSAMEQWASHVPGQYFIWRHEEDEVVALVNTGRPLLRRGS